MLFFVCLSVSDSAANELLLASHCQFVESRVHDDEDDPSTREASNTCAKRPKDSREMAQEIAKALEEGIAVIKVRYPYEDH